MKPVLERFLRYVAINTRSDDSITDRVPTTDCQWELARLLEKELRELGLHNVKLNDKAFVTAELPANNGKSTPAIGFLAHMDTSFDFNGSNIKPQIIENYDGGDVALKGVPGLKLSTAEFPFMKNYVGQTLVTTDGTSLLGADDKAGVAEIMTALAYLVAHPEFKHGPVKVAFTPDEETGMGVTNFDVKGFGADFAYTLDGGPLGELEYENFNANLATLTITGKSVHPGDAMNVMLNALLVAMEFNALLPAAERPEHTEKREGFYHLWRLNGSVESAKAVYLLRDHDRAKYEQRKAVMQRAADFINARYGAGTIDLKLEDRYFNMLEMIEPVIHIVDTARQAMEALGITPIVQPIRGGTDGSRLSFMGLPTPNLFGGGHNFHGPYEFTVVESMEKAVQVILKILELYSAK